MSVFTYEGKTASGQTVTGVVEAFDELDAIDRARASCDIVTKVEPVKEKKGFLTAEVGSGKIKTKTLAIMCSQFAIILSSGMNITRCCDLVRDQTSDKNLRKILERVSEDVSAGTSLSKSFENKGGSKLPVIFYETIRAGEQAGTLEDSFTTLNVYFDKQSKVKAKLAEALTYPIFVLVIAIVVVVVIMTFVMPTFKELLASYGSTMPLATQILINISDFFNAYGILMLLVVVALVIAFKVWSHSEKGRMQWATFKLKAPVFGTINVLRGAGQFANTMATLLTSGLHMTNAVEITGRVMDNARLASDVGKMTAELEEGKQLGDSMSRIEFIPRPLTEMVAVGEETGELEHTLTTMGEFYDEETDRATQRALSKLEPAIIVIMAIFAGYIVIALYLAMFAIYAGM